MKAFGTFRILAVAFGLAGAACPVWAQSESESEPVGFAPELVPELDAYFKLSDRSRVLLLADLARVSRDDVTVGEVGVHFDYTLMPQRRKALREADWARNRYLWVRVGYRRLGNMHGGSDGFAENRFLIEGTARFELPRAVWLAHRLRLDLRNVDGTSSHRFRYRIGAEKEFTTARGRVFVPYAQAELFYDSRFDAWSRQRYQLGVEVELSRSWRIESYYAYDKDTHPTDEDLSRIGLVLKFFH